MVVVYYGSRLPKICRFEDSKIQSKDATRDDCKEILRKITGDRYAQNIRAVICE